VQNVRYHHFTTADQRSTVNAEGSGDDVSLQVSGDRSFRFSAVALTAGATLVSVGGHDDTVGDYDPTRQLTANLTGSWRRDLGPRWSVALDGGLTTIVSFEDTDTSYQPTVGAQLGYFPLWGSAGATLRRSIAPNLLIQQNTITDSALIGASLPVPWLAKDPRDPKVTFSASTGASRIQLLGLTDSQPSGTYDVVGGDLSINYAVYEGALLSARYQYVRQFIDENSAATTTLFDYDRSTVLVSFGGRFPYRLAAEVPQRESMRVDRSNVTPVGEESTGTGGGGNRR
jgi:hypothetical protein